MVLACFAGCAQAAGYPVLLPSLDLAPAPPRSAVSVPQIAPSRPSVFGATRSESDFVLSAVSVEGSTVFDKSSFETTYAEFLGRRVGIDAVREIVRRITEKYRSAGLFLSHAIALPQSLAGGVLHVRVIEGYIGKVTVTGAASPEEKGLRAYTANLLDERPLRLETLERAVVLAGDLPGITIVPSIVPIDEATGRYELVLTTEPRLVSGYFAFDNRAPRYLGSWEAKMRGAAASVLVPFDQLSATFSTAPDIPREFIAGAVTYDAPIGTDGLRGSLSFARSSIHPGNYLASLDLSGMTTSYLARLSYPLLRSRASSLWLGGSFSGIDEREDLPGFLLFHDHLRVFRADAAYYGTKDWGGIDQAFVQISQGVEGLGASDLASSNLSTPNGHAAFTKIYGSFTRLQPLVEDFSLYLDIAGQKAGQPLLLSEQFSLGGAHFGRGYDPGEVLGDDALAGAVELRYGHDLKGGFLRSFQLYVFYDLGAVWNISVNNPQRQASLASAGGGGRFTLAQGFFISIEVAKPLTRPLVPNADKPVRVFARLTKTF